MPTWTFFKCLAKSIVFKGTLPAIRFALSSCTDANHLVNAIPEVAESTYECVSKSKTEPERVAEVEAMAPADLPEARRQATLAADEAAPALPADDREALVAYLSLVPATVRRSLRRPKDPTGMTVPPGLAIRKYQDIVPFLPTRMPRFKAGDYPLAGVDLVLEDLLGVGGFGEVWRARNQHTGVRVALKFCIDEAAAASLRKEAQLLGRVMHQGNHPGIVQLRQTYLSASPPFLEYELVEGGDLAGLIQEWHRAPTPPTPQQAARVMLRLAEAVGFAHSRGITHRDLKPANCLVRQSDAGGNEIKVADFGIGGLVAGEAIRETSRGGGQGRMAVETVRGAYTPLYAPPEQMRGSPPDPRNDVYALGVIWLQLLTGDLSRGAPAGDGWKRRLAERGVDPSTIRVLTSCFEDPDDRPRDASVLAAELAGLVGPDRVQASVPAIPPSGELTAPAATPDPLRTRCTSCGAGIKVPAKLVGKTVKCPRCDAPFVVGKQEEKQRHTLVLHEEVAAYEQPLAARLGGLHLAPHTLEVAAMWAVLTRLEPTRQEGVTVLDKLRLYDGQRLPGFTEDHVRALRVASQGEGTDGVSTAYTIRKIEEALSKASSRGYLGASDVLAALEGGIENPVPIGRPELVRHCRDMMTLARRDLEAALVADVEAAIPEPSAESLASRCMGYIDHVKAFTQREKVRNRSTGGYEDPDETLMRSVEERIGIPDGRKDDFRREIMNSIGALAIDGKRFTHETNEKLHLALVQIHKDEWAAPLTPAALSADVTPMAVREKADAVKSRLVGERGYADASAADVLRIWACVKARQKDPAGEGPPAAVSVPCPQCRRVFTLPCTIMTFGDVRCPECCVSFAPCRPERVRYSTRFREEIRCYERAVTPRLGGVHLVPHTLEVAALWAVLTRLEQPRKQGVTLIQKLKLYDGRHVPGLGEGDVTALRRESPNEGTFGVPPGYVLGRIEAALKAYPGETCLNPFMMLHQLELGLRQSPPSSSQQTLGHYQGLLVTVKEEYERIVTEEVQRAIAADEDALERLCSWYVDNVRAYTKREKVRNRYTGSYEDPDERLMRSVEEKIDVPEGDKDCFRREIMDQVGDCAIALRKFTSNTNPRLRLALELKLFEDQKDTIKLTSLVSNVVDGATQEKLDIVKRRLVQSFGYNEDSATDVMTLVASIQARQAR